MKQIFICKMSKLSMLQSSFLQPIKSLLNMDVRTKFTYRAALEGLDLSMVQILESIGYKHDEDINKTRLFNIPTDVRSEYTKQRLLKFETDQTVGIGDFLHYANDVMYQFLEVYHIGHLHELTMKDSGSFHIVISCLIHKNFCDDNKVSANKKFKDQIEKLTDLGLSLKKKKSTTNYYIEDTDGNRKILKDMFSSKGAYMINTTAVGEDIWEVTFMLKPEDLYKFAESPATYKFPITDELNDDEMIKLKKAITEIYHSLAFIEENPDMIQTCGSVAESYFSEICEITGHQGTIFKRVKERYAKERAANLNIHQIIKEIGEKFPKEKAKEAMTKLKNNLTRFCVENLHSVPREIQIDQWGTAHATIKWISNPNDFYHYIDDCTLDDEEFSPAIPDIQSLKEVFKIYNDDVEIYLKDVTENKMTITGFFNRIPGMRIGTFTSECKYFHDDIFIKEIDIAIDDICGMLQYYDHRK